MCVIDYDHLSCVILTERILFVKYGDVVISSLHNESLSTNAARCVQRRQVRSNIITEDMDNIQKICSNWPTIISDDIVFECLANYRHHTIWHQPHICCVCGLEQKNVTEIDVSNTSTCSLDFSYLHARDSFITDLVEFQYGSHIIDNCMLDKAGFKQHDEHTIIIQIYDECFSALNHKRIPRLSLTNYFYRGKLPDDFRDLTWVEEMVCTKYRKSKNKVHY